MKIASPTSLAFLCCLALAPSVASASPPCERSCRCPHMIAPVWAYPGGGTGAPANPRFFLPLAYEGMPQVTLHPEGEPDSPIPVTIEEVADADALWIVPDVELTPGQRYELEARWEHVAGGDPRHVSFMAGAPDVVPPAIVSASAGASPAPGSEPCDPLIGAALEVDVDDESAFDLLLRVEVERAGAPAQVFYQSAWRSAPYHVVLGASQGGDICAMDVPFGEESLPGAAEGEIIRVTITAIDEAGNTSEPFVLSDVELAAMAAGDPTFRGACCGCRAPGVPARRGALAAIPIALLAVWRLRRRR